MAELRGDDDLVAVTAQGRTDQGFAEAVLATVAVGRVDEVHARVERGADHRIGALLGLGRGADPPEVVAAEADRRDAKAGAPKGAVLESGHRSSLCGLRPRLVLHMAGST